ncbi:hypothetical protein Taro_018304 [Colocasia esculenta]|uniref:ubiquitinyl hydrolase 1 n=1 Tax=Colocasia esculenta TaxID=4460 RepID=A0A843UQL4_COLES|nr:hypothetical protein [Colocasia esculenta]
MQGLVKASPSPSTAPASGGSSLSTSFSAPLCSVYSCREGSLRFRAAGWPLGDARLYCRVVPPLPSPAPSHASVVVIKHPPREDGVRSPLPARHCHRAVPTTPARRRHPCFGARTLSPPPSAVLAPEALYFCVPFREQLLDYHANNKNTGEVEENLLTCLADLFTQDAHEFLNFLLNELADILEKELNDVKGSPETSSPLEKNGNGLQNSLVNGVKEEPQMTWVHKTRDETFLDLSLDIEQNSSITSYLKNFSSTETLNAEDKFSCDKCCRSESVSLSTPATPDIFGDCLRSHNSSYLGNVK